MAMNDSCEINEEHMDESKPNLKYSKSSGFFFFFKSEFFASNDELLKKTLIQNQFYSSQPTRFNCKVCNKKLPQKVDFHSHNIDYVFCEKCSHLNGKFEDTKDFAEKLYISEEGKDYSLNYIDKNFTKRTTDIYLPKVDFLISSLPPKKYEILDIGCGSGYFVFASLMRKLSATGIDVSKTMTDFGNHQIFNHFQNFPLKYTKEDQFFDSIVKSKAEIISAIGVIEHLREPHKFFSAFKKSKAKYLYYSVPMFSLSVALENAFKNVFPRQLSGGHTHLFTEMSIKKMNEIIGVEPVAEWRFGTDTMDLYRHLIVNLQSNNSSEKMVKFFNMGLGKIIDEIQTVFDKHHFCSEIHLIASKL